MRIRELTTEEKLRFKECLVWLNQQKDMDDPVVYAQRMREAQERWPDVAKAIGFEVT